MIFFTANLKYKENVDSTYTLGQRLIDLKNIKNVENSVFDMIVSTMNDKIIDWNNGNIKYPDFFIFQRTQVFHKKGININVIYVREEMPINSKKELENTVKKIIKDFIVYIKNEYNINATITVSYPTSCNFTFSRYTSAVFEKIIGLRISNRDMHRATYKKDDVIDNIMEDLNSEIKLIKKNKLKKYVAIPNGYIVNDDDNQLNKLIKTLYDNNIILSDQFVLQTSSFQGIDNTYMKRFSAFRGQAFVIKNKILDKTESELLFKPDDSITTRSSVKTMLDILMDTGIDMMPIFMVNSRKEGEIISECAEESGFVMINLLPAPINNMDKIINILNTFAMKDGFDKTFDNIEEGEYTLNDIKTIYLKWKRNQALQVLHPELLQEKPKSNIISLNKYYDDLNSMIGLAEIKKTISQIIAQFKIQSILSDRKVSKTIPCRHMIFYGNPGTAKTTVARLLGQILASEGILRRNKFSEVGRSALVAEYVGQTAVKTLTAIKRARGGILFIDEAYSLAETKGYYGDECISTLVQQMDIIKDDTIIIFAGYPEKMEEFLDKNEGLRSRIGFHVKFNNYTKEELIEILKLMADKKHFTLTDDALESAELQIDRAINTKDFGNGRFVRNLLEQAMMKQAMRLVDKNSSYRDLSTEELTTIKEEDIQEMNVLNQRRLGFC
jgi:AAA+ superfamily predicted ATPase